MQPIKPVLTKELLEHFGDPSKVAHGSCYSVSHFTDLVQLTARLSFLNKDYLLFYRGQHKDFINRNSASTFYPSIYRGEYVENKEIRYKFDILEGAGEKLAKLFEKQNIEGYRELKRRKSIQWSILQHYEVCETPLLDFTQSLRVASSFATLDNINATGIVSVFALPYVTNRISINSEQDIINIRLLSICPPLALRPYFQEGYLAGTDDITTNYDTKTELDFNNRLVAKFEIPVRASFWGSGFDEIPRASLYPRNDVIEKLCAEVREEAQRSLSSGEIGDFLKLWSQIETKLSDMISQLSDRNLTFRETIQTLYQGNYLSKDQVGPLERLRRFRNNLVHKTNSVIGGELQEYTELLKDLLKTLP